MSKLQTYISERKKLFKEKFVRDDGFMDKYIYLDTVDENGIPETVTTAEAIESFNEETIEGVINLIIEEHGYMNDGCGCCSDTILRKELEKDLQALNTKE